MKLKNNFTQMPVVLRSVCFTAAFLLLVVCFSGCQDEPEEDYSIGEITIYNIPSGITVFGADSNDTSPTFKVYLNSSDSQSDEDWDAARCKGWAKVSEGKSENGKITVTIQLLCPNPPEEDNPNYLSEPWSGTARYFSVMISPAEITEDGVNAVWVRAGTTLNKGKKNCDWNSLMDFRVLMENDPDDVMEFAKKTYALYSDIVCKDPEIGPF